MHCALIMASKRRFLEARATFAAPLCLSKQVLYAKPNCSTTFPRTHSLLAKKKAAR